MRVGQKNDPEHEHEQKGHEDAKKKKGGKGATGKGKAEAKAKSKEKDVKGGKPNSGGARPGGQRRAAAAEAEVEMLRTRLAMYEAQQLAASDSPFSSSSSPMALSTVTAPSSVSSTASAGSAATAAVMSMMGNPNDGVGGLVGPLIGAVFQMAMHNQTSQRIASLFFPNSGGRQ